MRNVRIKKLSLRNYRNVAAADLDFEGRDAMIVGENHVGKTNTLESIVFLFAAKLLDGSKDLQAIKSLKDTRAVASVEAVLEIEIAEDMVREARFRREFMEEWTTTRGDTEPHFVGHKQVLWVNGVKQATEKAFKAALYDEIGLKEDSHEKVEFLQMLLLPTYLGNLGETQDWTSLRSYVIKLVGDVSDDDVFAFDPTLKPIKDDLDAVKGKVDQLKKKYKQDVDGAKFSIQQAEAAVKLLEETARPSESEVAVARKGVEDIDAEIARLRSSQGTDEKSNQILAKLNASREELDRVITENAKSDTAASERQELDADLKAIRKEYYDLLDKKAVEVNRRSGAEYAMRQIEADLKAVSPEVNASIVEKIKKILADAEDAKVEDVCPTCGQPLPAEKVEAARLAIKQKAETEVAGLKEVCKVNKAKREELTRRREEQEKIISDLTAAIEKLDADAEKVSEAGREAKAKLDAFDNADRPMPENEKAVRAAIKVLEGELEESRREYLAGTTDVSNAIAAKQEEKEQFKKILDDLAYYERQMGTLARKRDELDKLRKQLAASEQRANLVSAFTKVKLQMLDANVSKVFGGIKFKLISENINGGYDPVCKLYVYDTVKGESTEVLWSSASKSERVETGIAVCEAVKKAANLPNLPYLFDEGGEISTNTFAERLKTKSQVICVRVVDDVPSPTVRFIK